MAEMKRKKVMIAVDESEESTYALRWALDHTVQPVDEVVLFHAQPVAQLYAGPAGPAGFYVTPEVLISMQKHQERITSMILENAKNICAEREMASIPNTSGPLEKRKRSKNWTQTEMLNLIAAKKMEWSMYESSSAREKMEPATIKWNKIASEMQLKGYDRDGERCRSKWENLVTEYKTIKDFQKKTGNPEYFSLSKDQRKEFAVPWMEREVYEMIDSFQSTRPSIDPQFTMDSSNMERSNPGVGVDTVILEETPGEETHVAGDREAGSSGKRRKSGGVEALSKTISDNHEVYVKTMVDMDAKREERHVQILELERKKIESESADRKEFNSLFGSLLSTWEKIGESMQRRA